MQKAHFVDRNRVRIQVIARAGFSSSALARTPVLIGRSSSNHIVIADPQIADHHGLVWVEQGRVYIRDIGDKGGVFRNEQKIQETELEPQDQVRLGSQTLLKVSLASSTSRQTGALGPQPSVSNMMRPSYHLYPYRLITRLDGPLGPEAILNAHEGRLDISAEQPATLLYLLARATSEDPHGGWVANRALRIGLWGRKRLASDNALEVAISRLRRRCREACFNPDFIQRRPGAARIHGRLSAKAYADQQFNQVEREAKSSVSLLISRQSR